MAIKFNCPCGKHYSLPDSAAGKRGNCSHCGATFVLPSPVSAAEPTPVPPAGHPIRPTQNPFLPIPPANDQAPLPADLPLNPFASPGSTTQPVLSANAESLGALAHRIALARAITLAFWGTLLTLLSPLMLIASAALAVAFLSESMAILAMGAGGLVLVGYLLSIAGRVLCLVWAPSLRNSGLVLGSIACDVCSITLTTLSVADMIQSTLSSLSGALTLASWLLFTLCLKGIATQMGHEPLRNDAAQLTWVLLVAIALPFSNLLFALLMPPVAIAIALTSLVLMLFCLVKYLLLLRATTTAVRPPL